MSVKSHLTYGASVRPENAVTYSAGNEGQKFCGVFSETAPLQRSSTPSIVRPCVQSAIFPAESTQAHYSMGLAPMCQSGLPADAAGLRETGSVDRYTPPVGPARVPSNSIAT